MSGLTLGSDSRDTRVGTVLLFAAALVPLGHMIGNVPTMWMTAGAYFGALFGGALLGGARQRQRVRDEIADRG